MPTKVGVFYGTNKEGKVKRLIRIYLGIFLVMLIRGWKKNLRCLGEEMKKIGRALVLSGEDNIPRFSIEFFHNCYLSDAEFHIGMKVYRGPMYSAGFSLGGELLFKLNWVSSRRAMNQEWETWGGACDFKLWDYGSPVKLPSGDIWFSFSGGYAVIFLGQPKERLIFQGEIETPKIYTYF